MPDFRDAPSVKRQLQGKLIEHAMALQRLSRGQDGRPGWGSADSRKAGFDEVISQSGVKLLASQPAY